MSAADPNVVDPASRREIISFGKNAGNHNGGTVAFGPDGYLYLATGDGGNANDVGASHVEPGGNAQNLTYAARQNAAHRSAQPVADAGQPRSRQQQRPVSHPDHQSVHGGGPGAGKSMPTDSAIRTATPSIPPTAI